MLLFCALCALPVFAWDDHAQLSYISLKNESFAGQSLRAETLESFVAAEALGLKALLESIEARAIKELSYYPPRPQALAFGGEGPRQRLVIDFIKAIRTNPAYEPRLFVKPEASAARTRPPLSVIAIDPFGGRFVNEPFEALAEGEGLTALEVIASAADEPDYGLDVGLFEDNGTEAGRIYGFGKQPFGNPALDFGTQAPFHMSFAHEDPIIALGASFSRKSLVELRFLQYSELSRFAFKSGHPYWGYRFAGWALHYLQDLCEPYHSRMVPGMSTLKLLAVNLLGPESKRDESVVLLSNRHIILEDYTYRAMAAADPKLYAALSKNAEPGPGRNAAYRQAWLIDEVSLKAYYRAGPLDRLITESFPGRYVADPAYDYGVHNSAAGRDYDPYGELGSKAPDKAAALNAQLALIFADMGVFQRSYMAWLLTPDAAAPPRRRAFDPRSIAYIAALAAVLVAVLFVSLRRPWRRTKSRSH